MSWKSPYFDRSESVLEFGASGSSFSRTYSRNLKSLSISVGVLVFVALVVFLTVSARSRDGVEGEPDYSLLGGAERTMFDGAAGPDLEFVEDRSLVELREEREVGRVLAQVELEADPKSPPKNAFERLAVNLHSS